jgi:hypothetical protein
MVAVESTLPVPFKPWYIVIANVSVPAGAVTPTVQVSGVDPFAGVQLGDAGVRFAVVVAAVPDVSAIVCVFGETNAGARCVEDVPAPDGIVTVNDACDCVIAPGRLD